MAVYLDTLPQVMSSIAPVEVVAEARSLVFDRLAESGDEGAVQVRAAQQAGAAPNAWRRVLSEALEGQPSLGAVIELHQANPEGLAAMARSEFATADRRGSTRAGARPGDPLEGGSLMPSGFRTPPELEQRAVGLILGTCGTLTAVMRLRCHRCSVIEQDAGLGFPARRLALPNPERLSYRSALRRRVEFAHFVGVS